MLNTVLPRELNFLAPIAVGDLVRLGSENDGGYVVPESIVAQAEVLISAGLSQDWSFEESVLARTPGATLHAYDHTVSESAFRRSALVGFAKLLLLSESAHEVRRRVRVWNSYRRFFKGRARHFQERLYDQRFLEQDVTLTQILARTESSKVLLKIDIEGGEYRIIDDILAHSPRILALVIEFHDTGPLRGVFVQSVQKLLRDFEPVHLHGNNCSPIAPDGLPEALEMTFVRRDPHKENQRRTDFPVPGLDHPNTPSRADYFFRFALHRDQKFVGST